MDILISDSWLRDFINTKATPSEIAKCLSLCGPSVEKVEKKGKDSVYSIEVTTNRVDEFSVYGIAREVFAILPRFGYKTILLKNKSHAFGKSAGKVTYLKAEVDFNLCSRFSAVLIKNVKIGESPKWIQERLIASGMRPINNIVDISNYLMHERGQPIHTFDYDKILKRKMILRESRKGEKIITLDGKKHILPGGDIVIEDGKGRLIDLAGIMGGALSAIDTQTKNVLLFVQTYNPINIRRTSMRLAHRTEAAVIFEKGLDTELVAPTMQKAIKLFVELTHGKPEKQILDLYPSPYKERAIIVNLESINNKLGIDIPKKEIADILVSLEFKPVWKGNVLKVSIPSFRAKDIQIEEDIIEEVARIYGYYNLPSKLMEGVLPEKLSDSPFAFESKIKYLLKGFGAVEVYTQSLVGKDFIEGDALKLSNPLGKDSEYLRNSLRPSLIQAALVNLKEEGFHLFEISNVYLHRKGDLPEERMILSGILSESEFQEGKGIIEALLEFLHINYAHEVEDIKGFMLGRRMVIKFGSQKIGEYGELEEKHLLYYEFYMDLLRKAARNFIPFKPLPKFPAQIEDMTLSFPDKTKIGEIIPYIKKVHKEVSNIELTDTFKNYYTFRIWYQNPDKTLKDKEVEEIRNKIYKGLKEKFGGTVKS